MIKRESKIILVSGVTINFKEEDKVAIVYDAGNDDYAVLEVNDIKDIPSLVMNKKADIIIQHGLPTGEYMEYYLTREKITWSYYSEEPVKDEEDNEVND